MGFINKLFSKKRIDANLIGTWISDSSEFPDTKMTFTSNGKLIYEINESEKVSIMNLTYEIYNDMIYSNQPSHPRVEKTKYSISGDVLTLYYSGEISKYKRIN